MGSQIYVCASRRETGFSLCYEAVVVVKEKNLCWYFDQTLSKVCQSEPSKKQQMVPEFKVLNKVLFLLIYLDSLIIIWWSNVSFTAWKIKRIYVITKQQTNVHFFASMQKQHRLLLLLHETEIMTSLHKNLFMTRCMDGPQTPRLAYSCTLYRPSEGWPIREKGVCRTGSLTETAAIIKCFSQRVK